jgi:hypothetical protein
MRHWVLGDILGIDGLAIEEAFLPDPGDNEVLIDVRAAALNFSDLLMIEGTSIHRTEARGKKATGLLAKSMELGLQSKRLSAAIWQSKSQMILILPPQLRCPLFIQRRWWP